MHVRAVPGTPNCVAKEELMPNMLTGEQRDKYAEFAKGLTRAFVWSEEKRGHAIWSAFQRNLLLVAEGQMPTIPIPDYDIDSSRPGIPLGCRDSLEKLRYSMSDLNWDLGDRGDL